MEFSFSSISMANLYGNGHNFITFSIMGMLIVFMGLTFISIYIVLLPKILNIPASLKAKKNKAEEDSTASQSLDTEIMLAISVALHLYQTTSGSSEKITWDRDTERESGWLTAGRMRGLAVRSHLTIHRS